MGLVAEPRLLLRLRGVTGESPPSPNSTSASDASSTTVSLLLVELSLSSSLSLPPPRLFLPVDPLFLLVADPSEEDRDMAPFVVEDVRLKEIPGLFTIRFEVAAFIGQAKLLIP